MHEPFFSLPVSHYFVRKVGSPVIVSRFMWFDTYSAHYYYCITLLKKTFLFVLLSCKDVTRTNHQKCESATTLASSNMWQHEPITVMYVDGESQKVIFRRCFTHQLCRDCSASVVLTEHTGKSDKFSLCFWNFGSNQKEISSYLCSVSPPTCKYRIKNRIINESWACIYFSPLKVKLASHVTRTDRSLRLFS